MKPFNLREYLKNPSRRIVTRDGRPAEIKCTNYVGTSSAFCVIAEVDVKNVRMSFLFRETDGRFNRYKEEELDLFFAPEKHEGWANIYKQDAKYRVIGYVYETKEEAERNRDIDYITTIKIEWEE